MVDYAVNNIQAVQEIILIDSIQNQSSYNMLYQMSEIDLPSCDALAIQSSVDTNSGSAIG